MGTTIVDRGIEKHVNEAMRNPKVAQAICEYLAKLDEGFYGWHQDVIFQKWGRFPLSIYDAYAFAQVHTMLMSGYVAIAAIHLGEPPSIDKDIEGNNAKLKRLESLDLGRWALQNTETGECTPVADQDGTPLFRGKFWGGTQDEDGFIEVSGEIVFDVLDDNRLKCHECYGGWFPLEVGYTKAAKTLCQINGHGGRLARWPYGSEWIYLMQNRSKVMSGDCMVTKIDEEAQALDEMLRESQADLDKDLEELLGE